MAGTQQSWCRGHTVQQSQQRFRRPLLLSAVWALLVDASFQYAPLESDGGLLKTSLIVDVGTVELGFRNISFRSRLYNGSFPGPWMRAAPGDKVEIRLVNNLGPNKPGTGCDQPVATYRAPNGTNLHLHGVYDNPIEDNTFVCIDPGSDFLYTYHIPEDSGNLLLWYHPHLDGSSSMQLASGMAGTFEIINEHANDPLVAVTGDGGAIAYVVPALVHQLDLNPSSKQFVETSASLQGQSDMPVDVHNPTNFTGALLLVNGRADGTFEVPAGRWVRYKLVNAVAGSKGMLNLGFRGEKSRSVCSLQVLGHDGVYLHAPRSQSTVLVAPGGRADIVVGCREGGHHVLESTQEGAQNLGGLFEPEVALLTLEVTGKPSKHMASLPEQLAGPPPYYQNLLGVEPDEHHEILLSNAAGSYVVNGWPYNGSVSHVATRNVVQEWDLYGGEGNDLDKVHPYHQHMVHFQIVRTSISSPLLPQVGEYYDTVPLYKGLNYTVRFVVPFLGRMMVHCHILSHEDLGMMTLVNFTDPPGLTVELSEAIAGAGRTAGLRGSSPRTVAEVAAFLVLGSFLLLVSCGTCFVQIRRERCRNCCHSGYTPAP